jgi:hypothetical protein
MTSISHPVGNLALKDAGRKHMTQELHLEGKALPFKASAFWSSAVL